MSTEKLFATSLSIIFAALLFSTAINAQTGTFTEWDAIATVDANGNPSPVFDFNPHITDLDRTGNTGFSINTPWYTIDNRTPGPPCALGHLEPSTNTLISWGYAGGVPVGIDVDDASGRVWFTVSGGITGVVGARVGFKFPGASNNNFRHFPGTGNAAGITLDTDGNAYFAELVSPDAIVRVTPAGTITRWPLPAPGSQEPRYLGFDSTGDNLYFTTANARTINRLNITTNLLTIWAFPTAAAGVFGILEAFGLFVQNDEAIWYADTEGDMVARLNPGTNVITEFTEMGMDAPAFIVISSANQAFITERFGNTVDVLDIDGGGGGDTPVTPTMITLIPVEVIVDPVDFEREPLSRVITPVVTTVTGTDPPPDPPGITRFPVPTTVSQPIGMTDVVEVAISPTETKFGIFGDEFAFSSSKIFLFESEIIGSQELLLFGVDEDSATFVQVDVSAATPEVIKLGDVVFDGKKIKELEAMAWDPATARIFVHSNAKGGRLFKIDPADIPSPPAMADIPAELVGQTGSTHIDGIAINPVTGELFGTDTKTEELVRIDKTTGLVISIGPLGFEDVEALTFSSESMPVLYGIDNEDHLLITIDTSTGQGTSASANEVGFRDVECLAFSPDNRLFAFSDRTARTFTTIDVASGIGDTFSVNGTADVDIEGITFMLPDSLLTASPVVTDIERDEETFVPVDFFLEQNYPNPFNPTTNINFDIAARLNNGTHVELRIYNILGEVVRTLLNENKLPGRYVVQWNGRNDNGVSVPSGIYIYRIIAGDFKQARRMLLLK